MKSAAGRGQIRIEPRDSGVSWSLGGSPDAAIRAPANPLK